MIDVEAIKARLAAATPAPWAVFYRCFVVARSGDVIVSTQSHPYQIHMDEDLALIAHAPADIAALLAEIERLTSLAHAADAWAQAIAEINGVQAAEQALLDAVKAWKQAAED